uniref:Uncharacterized protein n=1 Tax=Anguilla anguilla TaxID=7936 RepID=A0A0E9VMK1_ANGAN
METDAILASPTNMSPLLIPEHNANRIHSRSFKLTHYQPAVTRPGITERKLLEI